jgi:hypothetical protein
MPKKGKRKTMRGGMPKRVGMSMRGEGFFGDVWDGIKKAANWVKDRKIISGVAKAIPNPISQVVGNVAGAVGLGKRRGKTVMRGGSAVRF